MLIVKIPVSCKQFVISYTGYPDHSEHFYIPDADSSVKLWANALNEVIFVFSTTDFV